MSDRLHIRVVVNGRVHEREVPVRMTLADFLRHELRLTGTHLGCEHGVCGACTVLLDDRSARSCLALAVQADGARVTTVEGLARDGEPSVLQQAFIDHHGLQCGYCTPGMLITLTEFLRDHPNPSEADVRLAISGNLWPLHRVHRHRARRARRREDPAETGRMTVHGVYRGVAAGGRGMASVVAPAARTPREQCT